MRIATECLIGCEVLLGLFSPKVIIQSLYKMGLHLAVERSVVRILYTDWSVGLGENRPYQSSETFGGCASVVAVYWTEMLCFTEKKLICSRSATAATISL